MAKIQLFVLSISFNVLCRWAALMALCVVFPIAGRGQEPDQNVFDAKGVVTVVRSPGVFEINLGQQVRTLPGTTYAWADAKERPAGPAGIAVGAYLEVKGTQEKEVVTAQSIIFLGEKQVKGFGVIERVVEGGQRPVFEADGYRIRVSATATTQFSGKLKSLADVSAGNWIRYEGKRNPSGEVVAYHVEFLEGLTGEKKWAAMARESTGSDAIAAGAKLIAADGKFLGARSKVRMSDAGGQCGWHRLAADDALQQRVWRVGMRVVPEYQNEMAPNSREKLRFRFYATDEPTLRSEVVCNPGLILVPAQVASRLTTDDELAAVLADGVAVNLQWEAFRLPPDKYLWLGANAAVIAAAAAGPWGMLAIDGAAEVANHEVMKTLEEQRGRMALAIMAAAGYDPWAAPEAWRLLAPKELSKNTATLKYPGRSQYQLEILHLDYEPTATGTSNPN